MATEKTQSNQKTEVHERRTDVLTPEQRSHCMSSIKGQGTKPEKIVRSLVFKLGYRYRLYDKRLPGKPDLVFRNRRKIIFVHGCFWHMHDCRYGQVKPRTNEQFWETKRSRSAERDHQNEATLLMSGWKILTIWECETKDRGALAEKIRNFLQ